MDVLGTTPGDDTFTDVLGRIRISGSVFCRPECSDPWGIAIGQGGVAYFHIITKGRCTLDLPETGDEVDLRSGDIVILPFGDAHRLRDDPATPAPWLERPADGTPSQPFAVVRLGPGRGRPTTTMICGGLTLQEDGAAPLLSALPPILHVVAEENQTGRWLAKTLQLVEHEVLTPEPGADGVVNRLSEILFIQALRAYFRRLGPGRGGWIGGLKDPQIGKAIRLMTRDCRRQWTVPELAAATHLSRSAFATRFVRLTGDTPMRFLRRWRVSVAADMLRHDDRSIGQVAHQVGYHSTVAFAKAFKGDMGIAPGQYRASGSHRRP